MNILCFEKAKQINRRSLPASKVKNLTEKLDLLFDISSCCCELPVLPCEDYRVKCNKENCCSKHIICTCPFQKKVPVEDREYLKDQRCKIGPKGTFQLGPIDKCAIKKSKKQQKRLRKKLPTPTASTYNLQDIVSVPSSPSFPSEELEEYFQPQTDEKGPYSLTKFPRYALELVRGDISSNVGASLANALLWI